MLILQSTRAKLTKYTFKRAGSLTGFVSTTVSVTYKQHIMQVNISRQKNILEKVMRNHFNSIVKKIDKKFSKSQTQYEGDLYFTTKLNNSVCKIQII